MNDVFGKHEMHDLTIGRAVASIALIGAISLGDEPAPEVGTMTIQEFYEKLTGEWTGSYELWLDPTQPSQNSGIVAHGRLVAKGSYFLLSYSWEWEGERQEGVFLMGGDGEKASATWGDSWHMQPEPMICEGELSEEDQKLVFLGSYGAGPGVPDWGWRTEFTLQGEGAFLMEAYNITPEGLESLAVRAELTRK